MRDYTQIALQRVNTSKTDLLTQGAMPPFGSTVSDHMLVARYAGGEWLEAQIEPFGKLSFHPTLLALHYGQSVFEGMKAFRQTNGQVALYRPQAHYQRFMRSCERMCIPVVPEQLFMQGIRQLVQADADWVPAAEDGSLYIRPFTFATEERFGVKIAEEYLFIIFTGPVGPYYAKPLRVKVEDHYTRAGRGGTGYAKCAGGAFYPTNLAREQGFDQVLWTDRSERLNIEESGTMNVMFVLNGVLTTPPLSDSILAGITRDSLITLAREAGIPLEERPISAFELADHAHAGTLHEAFGAGTAAVISPIETIVLQDQELTVKHVMGPIATQLKARLEAIRAGIEPDTHNWMVVNE